MTPVSTSQMASEDTEITLGTGKMLADFDLLNRVSWENTMIHHSL